MRDWTLKWVEGSILGYVKGSVSLNNVLGVIAKSRNYGVSVNDEGLKW